MMDADDTLEGDKHEIDSKYLDKNAAAYQFNVHYNEVRMKRLHLFNSDYDWRYMGVLHEYPKCFNKDFKIFNISSNIFIEARSEGCRSQNPNKYKDDAILLQKEYDDNIVDPSKTFDKSRTLFYLAQSYKDSGDYISAFNYYKLRYENGGWVEEQYVSLCRMIQLTENIDDKINYTWKAQELIQTRRDAVYLTLSYARNKDLFSQQIYALGYTFANVKYNDNHLFNDVNAYGWNFFDELGVVAYYTKHYDTAVIFFNKAM